jgi:hypothetical protein
MVDEQNVLIPRPLTVLAPVFDAGLKDFLSRPLLINSFQWTTTASLDTNLFNSITTAEGAYFQLLTIKRKVSDYRYIRGTFVLRFTVNGCPHSYGRLQIVNFPFMGQDNNDRAGSEISSTRSMPCAAQSYCMDPVRVNPTESGTYEMRMPVETCTGWIDLNLAKFSNAAQQGHMVQVLVATPLRSVTALAAPPVTVTTYGYWENPELAVSLSKVQSELKPNGIFSKPLSIFSEAMGAVSTVPALAPYTTPIAAASGFGSKVLQMMGLSKPLVMEVTRPTMNNYSTTMAVTAGREPIGVSAMDPMCSVPVDAATAGIGEDDDMMIGKIISKPGQIGTFDWHTTDAASTVLVEFPCTPMSYFTIPAAQYSTTTSGQLFAPVGYVGGAFTYWTGELIYTFHIECTAFHRGTISIFYDPVGNAFPRESNTVNPLQQVVVDLRGPTTVDFCVPWSCALAMKQNVVATNFSETWANGSIYVVVTNPLETIGSTENLTIQYTVKAGSEFSFARPINPFQSSYKYQNSNDVLSAPCLTHSSAHDQVALCFGETVTNLRDLMKRKNFCEMKNYSVGTNTAVPWLVTASWPVLPRLPGYNPDPNTATASSMLGHFMIMYAGYRGSTRHIMKSYALDATPIDTFYRQFMSGDYGPSVINVTANGIGSVFDSGVVTADLRRHHMLEVQVPFMSTTKVAKAWYVYLQSSTIPSPVVTWSTQYVGGSTTGVFNTQRGVSAGDDFSCYRFINIPILWL